MCDLASYIEDSHEYRYTYDKHGNLILEENCQRTTQGSKWLMKAPYAYNAANRHDYDVMLELYYAKARMYDPLVKRFTQLRYLASGI